MKPISPTHLPTVLQRGVKGGGEGYAKHVKIKVPIAVGRPLFAGAECQRSFFHILAPFAHIVGFRLCPRVDFRRMPKWQGWRR